MKKAVVTGGGGFIGAYLTRRLVRDGWAVCVVDNLARGRASRLSSVIDDVDFRQADVRNLDALVDASRGAQVIFHLAAVNGTENFYNHPDLVLDVGLRGALAAIEAGKIAGVPEMVMASSAEVYQTPPTVPTDETVPLMLPNSLNPRYSYGGSKIVTELIAFNYFREHYEKVQVFRPHNVYGPDMGWKHVIPQFIMRAQDCIEAAQDSGPISFPIQGDGTETRAFAYVEDVVDGIVMMQERGRHREVYHIGNPEMVSIRSLVEIIGKQFDRELCVDVSPLAEGGTKVRCPDINKLSELGYTPKIGLSEGISRTTEWYVANKPDSSNALL